MTVGRLLHLARTEQQNALTAALRNGGQASTLNPKPEALSPKP